MPKWMLLSCLVFLVLLKNKQANKQTQKEIYMDRNVHKHREPFCLLPEPRSRSNMSYFSSLVLTYVFIWSWPQLCQFMSIIQVSLTSKCVFPLSGILDFLLCLLRSIKQYLSSILIIIVFVLKHHSILPPYCLTVLKIIVFLWLWWGNNYLVLMGCFKVCVNYYRSRWFIVDTTVVGKVVHI